MTRREKKSPFKVILRKTAYVSFSTNQQLLLHFVFNLVLPFSEANITCQLIGGKARGDVFFPWEKEFDNVGHWTWASFKSRSIWHLVNPHWMTTGLAGHEDGNKISLERDGQQVFEERVACEGHIVSRLDDFWFCLNPIIFSIYFYPDDMMWSLLPPNKYPTQSDFLYGPYLLEGFFRARLSLYTEPKSVLTSRNGCCTITLGADQTVMKHLSFEYEFSFITTSGDISVVNPAYLPRLVLFANRMDRVDFTIRFPVKGEYLFQLSVKCEGVFEASCLEARILCQESDPFCRKLPIDAKDHGFGFGHTAREFGLHHPSSTTSSLRVDDNREALFRCKIDSDVIDDVEFSSDVVGYSSCDTGKDLRSFL